ncbi:MAG TPA: protein kinase, partial [Sporichthya sp.]|nr:protein kinase [Sporichthya sp.]
WRRSSAGDRLMSGETQPNSRPTLAGRYRLDERIARGGMGEVWRATDEVLNRAVAVKVLRPEYADEEIFLERFRSEARNTAALVHTGIAQVYDFGQAPSGGASVPFIVMELVPGEPLSHIIERDGALDVDRALELVAQAAQALQVAHVAGVIHRDIKPANLLITPAWTVKVTDFGIARAGDSLPLTRSGTVMGTAHYLAPELISTKSGAAPASDVYALGVVLYECLAGHRPFSGDNPLAVAMAHLHNKPPPIEGMPAAVNAMVARILAKDAADRPASAADLAQQLLALRIDLANPKTPEVVAEALGPAADPSSVRVAAARWKRRSRVAEGRAVGGAGESRAAPDTPPDTRLRPAGRPEVQLERGPVGRRLEPVPISHRAPGRRRKPRAPVRRRPVVLAAAATLMAVALTAVWLSDPGPGTAVVPALAGVAEYDAGQALKANGLTAKITREVNETVPAGVVLSQSPEAGTRISTDHDVEIRVSSGPPSVLVDPTDWVGKPAADVRSGLESRGLKVEEQQVSAVGATGTVADVTPHGPVPVGDTVVVSVVVAPSPTTLGARAAPASENGLLQAGTTTGRNGQ